MKHEKKEWCTCDRCGADIKEMPYRTYKRWIFRKILCNPSKFKVLTNDRYAYISDTEFVLPEIVSAEIVEGYLGNEKTIYLCGKCRKDFERFMRK